MTISIALIAGAILHGAGCRAWFAGAADGDATGRDVRLEVRIGSGGAQLPPGGELWVFVTYKGHRWPKRRVPYRPGKAQDVRFREQGFEIGSNFDAELLLLSPVEASELAAYYRRCARAQSWPSFPVEGVVCDSVRLTLVAE